MATAYSTSSDELLGPRQVTRRLVSGFLRRADFTTMNIFSSLTEGQSHIAPTLNAAGYAATRGLLGWQGPRCLAGRDVAGRDLAGRGLAGGGLAGEVLAGKDPLGMSRMALAGKSSSLKTEF